MRVNTRKEVGYKEDISVWQMQVTLWGGVQGKELWERIETVGLMGEGTTHNTDVADFRGMEIRHRASTTCIDLNWKTMWMNDRWRESDCFTFRVKICENIKGGDEGE